MRKKSPKEERTRRVPKSMWIVKERVRNSQHLPSCFRVVPLLRNTREVLDGGLKCPQGENVSDWVAALVRRAKNGVSRPRDTLSVPICVRDRQLITLLQVKDDERDCGIAF